jgi:EpsI family protein
MTTSRLATLVAFMALGFATVFLLPKSYEQPSGIRLELPDFVGNWKGTDAEMSEKERTTLGESSGTRFARKTYRSLDGYEIMVSIVLSGRDMSTAIHRPERCLQAQGWTLQEGEQYAMSLPQRGVFPVEQLRSTRLIKSDEGAITRELQTFYWFVGERDICASHWGRWAIDNRDRLFRGVSQRWAFILVSGGVPVPKDPKDNDAARKWSQNAMREFIRMLAPKIHLDSVRYN